MPCFHLMWHASHLRTGRAGRATRFSATGSKLASLDQEFGEVLNLAGKRGRFLPPRVVPVEQRIVLLEMPSARGASRDDMLVRRKDFDVSSGDGPSGFEIASAHHRETAAGLVVRVAHLEAQLGQVEQHVAPRVGHEELEDAAGEHGDLADGLAVLRGDLLLPAPGQGGDREPRDGHAVEERAHDIRKVTDRSTLAIG
jgi:hypothetical protein